MKTTIIAGASGFVGQYLSRLLLSSGHRVTGLGTSSHHPLEQEDRFRWICADTTMEGNWQEQVASAGFIINLTGRSIFKPWSKTYKQAIYDSRILTTRHLVSALPDFWDGHLLNASAVGIYGDKGDDVLPEGAPQGADFLATVCQDWEREARGAEGKGAVVSFMRFGVVLGQSGGALSVMGKAFKSFLGGPLGSGNQWFPWIHLQDLGRAVLFLMDNKLGGAFNFTGPAPLRQKEFARALGRALNRPALMPAPAFVVRLVMGELGSSLLQSQRAVPLSLEGKGFSFTFRTVQESLADIYSGSRENHAP